MLMLTSNKISYFSLVQAGLLTIIAVSFLVSFGAESVADESWSLAGIDIAISEMSYHTSNFHRNYFVD